MSLLTDTDIRARLSSDKAWEDRQSTLNIFPFLEDSLTPVGYDLRVGEQYASSIDAEIYDLTAESELQVKPGDVVLITTMETIGMPKDLSISAFITSKVSIVSKGLSHISTNVDPDWEGKLLIAIHNPSLNAVTLTHGKPFCTINFIQNLSASKKASGKPAGRTDILLGKIVESLKDAKREREDARQRAKAKIVKRHRIFLVARAAVIIGGVVAGFYFFGNDPGFIACTAAGIGLASLIKTPSEEK